MPFATFEGTVERGQIQLREQIVLPEHTRVFVLVPDFPRNAPPADTPPRLRSPRLVNPQDIAEFSKIIVDRDSDATV